MHNIQAVNDKLTEGKATDLLFTGFRQAMRDGMNYAHFNSGCDAFGLDVVEVPRVNQLNGQKYWSLRLYCDCKLVATAYADEHDL